MKPHGADDALTLFELWYENEAEQLYRFIWVRVQHTPTAEELTAAVCEQVLDSLDRFDPALGSMRAWVYGVARNVLLTALRKEKRGPQTVSLDALYATVEASRPIEQAVQRREAYAAVLRHMQHLPSGDREVIALRYGAGLSNPEIAEVTGMSVNYVAVRLHRAIRKLRTALNMEAQLDLLR